MSLDLINETQDHEEALSLVVKEHKKGKKMTYTPKQYLDTLQRINNNTFKEFQEMEGEERGNDRKD